MLVAMIIQAVSAPSILSVGVGVCASAGVAVPAAAIAAAISRRQVTQPTARVIIGVIIRVIVSVIIDSHVIMMLVPVAWTLFTGWIRSCGKILSKIGTRLAWMTSCARRRRCRSRRCGCGLRARAV